MPNELEPCPFCGCEAVDGYYHDPFDGYQGDCSRYRLRCQVCGVSLERKTKQEAIEAWNRRNDEELDFTRQFIHDHGLEWELLSAWNRRAD